MIERLRAVFRFACGVNSETMISGIITSLCQCEFSSVFEHHILIAKLCASCRLIICVHLNKFKMHMTLCEIAASLAVSSIRSEEYPAHSPVNEILLLPYQNSNVLWGRVSRLVVYAYWQKKPLNINGYLTV